jgi:hypothetical protein
MAGQHQDVSESDSERGVDLTDELLALARHPNMSMLYGAAAIAARRAGHAGAVVQFENEREARAVLEVTDDTCAGSLKYWYSEVDAVDACDDVVDAVARSVRPATRLEVELARELDVLEPDDKNVTAFYVGAHYNGAAPAINRRLPCLGCTLSFIGMKRCSGCAVYCSETCQRNNWQEHKTTCRWLKSKIGLFQL